MSLQGLDGYLVEVQVDISGGMPSCDIVGLPDMSVKESKERVRTAIKNSGIDLKSRKMIINLAPANTRKEGAMYDLPIAVATILANEELDIKNLDNTVFIGELSLDGKIKKVNGIFPMCLEAYNLGIKKVIIPYENAKEAAIVKDLEVIGVKTLNEVMDILTERKNPEKVNINLDDFFSNNNKYNFDFIDVKGQEEIKRALEVTAAGGHNCLLIGSPGSGKTMMSRCLPSILPDLTFKESLEITKIHSVLGLLPENKPLIITRPFRAPHHTISGVSLIGGGRIPKPGEISLSHNGVLFLDELPEFPNSVLELLRVPLEDKKININRINASFTYPCNFMLIASMNPCPCGYYGSKDKECVCSEKSINKYMNKISGPLLDRIDIQIEVEPVKYQNLDSSEKGENSETIKKRVNRARKIQQERLAEYGLFSNAELTPKLIEKFCKLDQNGRKILKNSFEKLGLSARAYGRILKVARTIADLDEKENIQVNHLAEAIQYRNLDRKYWKN
jgi:magnesium chelatase family protein